MHPLYEVIRNLRAINISWRFIAHTTGYCERHCYDILKKKCITDTPPHRPRKTNTMLDQLRKDGVVYASWSIQAKEVLALNLFLSTCVVYNAHVKAKSTKVESEVSRVIDNKSWPVFCVSMEDIVRAPYFFEYALIGFDLAEAYFGEFPRLYSMNCFWTQPAFIEYKDTHWWHVDGDDRQQLVMFMYGNDVSSPEEGSHLYQAGSNNHWQDIAGNSPSNYSSFLWYECERPPEDKVISILGKAGTCFFTDPRGFHMAPRPNKLRMLCWARWGVSEMPESYKWDELTYVPRSRIG